MINLFAPHQVAVNISMLQCCTTNAKCYQVFLYFKSNNFNYLEHC